MIDDEPHRVDAYRLGLEGTLADHEILLLSHEHEVMKLISEQHRLIDCIILDLMLPAKNVPSAEPGAKGGLVLLERIRQSERENRLPHCPVIALTNLGPEKWADYSATLKQHGVHEIKNKLDHLPSELSADIRRLASRGSHA